MNKNDTKETGKKQMFRLFVNIALMVTSFIIALVALPYEMFFIVAVFILIALHHVEKDINKTNSKHVTISARSK